ncbi:LysR family transcriptional regulator [Primorskyibacter aestuariivivens]|uniref:LysR family transcriptional regulator n=1 Tax=Primorskyibacter aestuariivivens TaxID=1888912 RepID=UPI0022FFD136|nr:LysR family transcriptional regulator [Primorskyibacter aestuariivivens]MDA7430925.1 LysR family transcriptional regulator [Primorskyibacter aestuariivivens]
MHRTLPQRLKPSQLKLIRAIQDCGKLQLAAETVGMSQPAASRMLSEIETNVGAPLFERLPRGMAATEIGMAFVRHAQVILSELDTLANEVAQLRGGNAGAVRIGAVTGPAVGVLVPALKAVREEIPGLQPTIEVAPSVTLIRGLEEGHFDFVLARLGSAHHARDFMAHPGRTEVVSLVARAAHPLVGRTVSLSDTLPYDFVIQEPGSPIRAALEHSFLEHRLEIPARVTNSSSLLVALSLISEADTIAPQTREVAQVLSRTNANLAIIETTESIVVSPYLVLQTRHRQLSPVAQRLLDEVLRRL